MPALPVSSTFTVGGLDNDKNVASTAIQAKFLTDENGIPIIDPVVGGSQKWNLYVNGTRLNGVDANPNNYLIVPANYSLSSATTFAGRVTDSINASVGSDLDQSDGLGFIGLMTGAFSQNGSQDLQRNAAWGIPPDLSVPAFQDAASYHLGLVTSLSGLPLVLAEVGGGIENQSHAYLNKFINWLTFGYTDFRVNDTSGDFGLSVNNSLNLNAGFKHGSQLLENLAQPTPQLKGRGSGSVGVIGEIDRFPITLTAGHTYQFDLEGAPTAKGTLAEPKLTLYSSTGSFVKSAFSSGNPGTDARITYTPSNDGTFYLSASATNNAGTGSYQLGMSLPDDYTDTTSTAGALAIGGTTTGNLEALTDEDYFGVSLLAGRTYQFVLEGAPTGQGTVVEPRLVLYSSTGSFVKSAFSSGNPGTAALITYTPTADGTIYLDASATNNSGTGIYRLSAAAADDYTNTTSTTGVLAIGGTTIGNLEALTDEDYFRVSLVAGRTYQFDLEGAPTAKGTLVEPRLVLYSSTGSFVKSAFSSGNPGTAARITYTPTSSGIFYLDASATNNSGTGTYQLHGSDTSAGTPTAAVISQAQVAAALGEQPTMAFMAQSASTPPIAAMPQVASTDSSPILLVGFNTSSLSPADAMPLPSLQPSGAGAVDQSAALLASLGSMGNRLDSPSMYPPPLPTNSSRLE